MGFHKGQSLTNVCSKISLEPTACFSTEQLSNTFVHNNQSSLSAHLQFSNSTPHYHSTHQLRWIIKRKLAKCLEISITLKRWI